MVDSCRSSICKFDSFKNPFATITSLSELYCRFRRFILLVQTKKVISMNYGSSTSCWKPWRWVRFDLISIPTWTHLQNLLAAEALSYPPMEDLSNDHDDHPNQHENSRKLCNETGHSVLSLIEKSYNLKFKFNRNWDNNMIRISQLGENDCRTNTSIRRNISKRAGLWESQSGIGIGKLTIWGRSFEIEKL